MEKQYRVAWEIDIWAETPEDAAREAAGTVKEMAHTSVYRLNEVNEDDDSSGPDILIDLDTSGGF